MPDAKRAGAWPTGVRLEGCSDAYLPEADLRKWQDAIDNSLLKYQQAVNMAARGWMPLGVTDPTPGWLRPTIDLEVDRIVADVKRAADRYSIKQPAKVVTGISTQQWLDAVENYAMPSRHFIGFDPATFNERSKPVGLKEPAKYEDAGWRKLVVGYSAYGRSDNTWIRTDSAGAYVKDAEKVAVALNVLGYDRPEAGALVQATVGFSSSAYSSDFIAGSDSRDRMLAEAVARLLAIDAYDQQEVVRKAEEAAKAKAEAEAAAQAKRDAEQAKQKQESFDLAKQAYADAIRDQIASGITAESAGKVQIALSAYETARRKLEGLPF